MNKWNCGWENILKNIVLESYIMYVKKEYKIKSEDKRMIGN